MLFSDVRNLQKDFTQFLQAIENPQAALSVTLSECYGFTESDPNLVEMIARVLYHITLNCFYVAPDGKFHQDTADYEMFVDALTTFSRKHCEKLNLDYAVLMPYCVVRYENRDPNYFPF